LHILHIVATDAQQGDVATKSDDSAGVISDDFEMKRHAVSFMLHASGAIKVKTRDGSEVTLPACAVGVPIPIAIRQVFATGTTVTNGDITLLYNKV
jgi:hypothetical protein